MAFCGAETWTFQKIDKKIPGKFRDVGLEKFLGGQLDRSYGKEGLIYSAKDERNVLDATDIKLTGLVTTCVRTAF